MPPIRVMTGNHVMAYLRQTLRRRRGQVNRAPCSTRGFSTAATGDGVVRDIAPDAEYTDHPREVIMKGTQQLIEYLKANWCTAFSDATVANVRYSDAEYGGPPWQSV